jgi:uracil-DNA glycosylase family 4
VPSSCDNTGLQGRLAVLHQAIDECTVCADHVPGLVKIQGVRRGEPGKIMIIGQGPGRQEAERRSAFAGQSGTRLDRWLVEAGADPANPRGGIYLTSVTKCVPGPGASMTHMVKNCRRFLLEQLAIIKPSLLVTLGKPAYEQLRVSHDPYEQALCRLFHSESQLLFPGTGFHYALLPWPHPSGLNRWHNEPGNRSRLVASFDLMRPFLRPPE